MSFASVRRQRAFTLIELLVVILIIAILIAVALPAFLGQTAKANNSVVEQQLTNAYVNTKAVWTSQGNQSAFPGTSALVADLQQNEPGMNFVADPFITGTATTGAAGVGAIGVASGTVGNTDDMNVVTLCEESQTGTFYCLRADETGGLIDITGANNTAAEATSSLAPASAQASASFTNLVRATGATEAAALCVLQAATPNSESGAGGGDSAVSGCESATNAGYPGWTQTPTNGSVSGSSGSGSSGGSGGSGSSSGATGTPPANVVAPTITNANVTGTTIVASPGTWSGSPFQYGYVWYDCPTSVPGLNCTAISGATGYRYTLQNSDLNGYVTVSVFALNSNGSSTALFAQTADGPVIGGVPSGGSPAITAGSPYLNSTLQGSPGAGTWSNSPTSFSYQWFDCADAAGISCTAISGATSQNHTVTSADIAKYVELQVTATNSLGTGPESQAIMSQPILGGPVNTAAPTISSSNPASGTAVTGAPGNWSNMSTGTGYSYSYAWYDCPSASSGGSNGVSGCAAGTGTTASGGTQYTPASGDIGSYLVLAVTATNPSASTVAYSTVQGPVTGLSNTAAPAISGTEQYNQTVTVSNGTWKAYPAATYSYQWYRCTGPNSGCSAIGGATAANYVPTNADIEEYMEAKVTATSGANSSSLSPYSSTLVASNPQFVGINNQWSSDTSALSGTVGYAWPTGASIPVGDTLFVISSCPGSGVSIGTPSASGYSTTWNAASGSTNGADTIMTYWTQITGSAMPGGTSISQTCSAGGGSGPGSYVFLVFSGLKGVETGGGNNAGGTSTGILPASVPYSDELLLTSSTSTPSGNNPVNGPASWGAPSSSTLGNYTMAGISNWTWLDSAYMFASSSQGVTWNSNMGQAITLNAFY